MSLKKPGRDRLAKCLTKIVYYMRHFASLLWKFFHVNGRKKNEFFFRFRTYILFYKVRFEKIVGQFSCSTYPPITILGENLSTPIEKNNQKNQMYRFFIKYNTFEYTLVFLASPQLRYEMSRFHIEHPVYIDAIYQSLTLMSYI